MKTVTLTDELPGISGGHSVEVEPAGELYGVQRSPSARGGRKWCITHMASGFIVGHVRTKHNARIAAKALSTNLPIRNYAELRVAGLELNLPGLIRRMDEAEISVHELRETLSASTTA